MMNDAQFFKDLFSEESFVNTNWYDQLKSLKDSEQEQMTRHLKDMLCCASCDRMVIDCHLEDRIRGLGDDENSSSLDKYMPLNTCLKCLEGKRKFILCLNCT